VVVDAVAPWAVITPRVHNIHHSADQPETDSNFGIVSTVWDRLFRTYRMTTPTEDAARVIGLEYFRDDRSARLDRVLLIPFLPFTASEDVQPPTATAMRSDASGKPS
jgi:sterol desaturase/sphingolipid hydroxylase (fatty acid hydroxylase superfamily)